MTVKEALIHAREVLAAGNIEDSALEAELLLRCALGRNRVQLYQGFDRQLSPEQNKMFQDLVRRRLNREPTAYITGHREFYGIDFYVNPAVLIPRPESELLVEKALELAQYRSIAAIADIGTGCGAIAVSLALNLPCVKIYATDVSTAALEVALVNCRRHGVSDKIRLLAGDMLDPLPEPADLIVANLPYIKESELAQVNTRDFEPHLALNGGTDGLEKIRRLCTQVGDKLKPGGHLLLEIGQGQEAPVITLLRDLFPVAGIAVTPDLGGIDRVVNLTLFAEATRLTA
ncbi:MAG: peptide chain release factor N(5)-glutamine methyltransferase [Dehalococcoidales bacterium]|nr:peptide chain release factor N(5)-glutamine methyltransferase [Dehalococcoidales bacterium]